MLRNAKDKAMQITALKHLSLLHSAVLRYPSQLIPFKDDSTELSKANPPVTVLPQPYCAIKSSVGQDLSSAGQTYSVRKQIFPDTILQSTGLVILTMKV